LRRWKRRDEPDQGRRELGGSVKEEIGYEEINVAICDSFGSWMMLKVFNTSLV